MAPYLLWLVLDFPVTHRHRKPHFKVIRFNHSTECRFAPSSWPLWALRLSSAPWLTAAPMVVASTAVPALGHSLDVNSTTTNLCKSFLMDADTDHLFRQLGFVQLWVQWHSTVPGLLSWARLQLHLCS